MFTDLSTSSQVAEQLVDGLNLGESRGSKTNIYALVYKSKQISLTSK